MSSPLKSPLRKSSSLDKADTTKIDPELKKNEEIKKKLHNKDKEISSELKSPPNKSTPTKKDNRTEGEKADSKVKKNNSKKDKEISSVLKSPHKPSFTEKNAEEERVKKNEKTKRKSSNNKSDQAEDAITRISRRTLNNNKESIIKRKKQDMSTDEESQNDSASMNIESEDKGDKNDAKATGNEKKKLKLEPPSKLKKKGEDSQTTEDSSSTDTGSERKKKKKKEKRNLSPTKRLSLRSHNGSMELKEDEKTIIKDTGEELKKPKRTLRSQNNSMEIKEESEEDMKKKTNEEELKKSKRALRSQNDSMEIKGESEKDKKVTEQDMKKGTDEEELKKSKRTLRSQNDSMEIKDQSDEDKKVAEQNMKKGTDEEELKKSKRTLRSQNDSMEIKEESEEGKAVIEEGIKKETDEEEKLKTETVANEETEEDDMSLHERFLRSTKSPNLVPPLKPKPKVRLPIVNPINYSLICKSQVRIILNPLKLEGSNLVPNPFKNKPKNPKFKRKFMSSAKNASALFVKKNIRKRRHLVAAKKEPEEIADENLDIKNIKTESINYNVGDLAWAKIGTHSYWPCMITEEPFEGVHMKTVPNRSLPMYHVRFFGDKGRRSWVYSNRIMLYFTRDDLDRIAKTLKTEDRHQAALIKESYTVRPAKLAKWQEGVDEIEKMKPKTVQERLDFFFDTFASDREKKDRMKELGIKEEVLDATMAEIEEQTGKKRQRSSNDSFDTNRNAEKRFKKEEAAIKSPDKKKNQKSLAQSVEESVDNAEISPRSKKSGGKVKEAQGELLSPKSKKKSMSKSGSLEEGEKGVEKAKDEDILSPKAKKKAMEEIQSPKGKKAGKKEELEEEKRRKQRNSRSAT